MVGVFAAVLSLMLSAEGQAPDSLQSLELQEDASRLFILGEGASEAPGLYTEVRQCLEDLYRDWKTNQLQPDLEDRLKNCLAKELRQSDLHFEFTRRRADNPALLDLIYQNTLRLLPEGKKSHWQMRRRNLLEIKYREHLVRFPIFSDALLFPGWGPDDATAIEDLILDKGSLPTSILEMALGNGEVSASDYTQIFSLLHPQASQAEKDLALARYQFFGRAFIHQWSLEEWTRNLEQQEDLPEEVNKWIKVWKEDLFFYAKLLELELQSTPIDWNSPSFFSAETLNSLTWVDQQYASLWPTFQTEFPLREIAREARKLNADPRLPLLSIEIEKFIIDSGIWSSEEALQFRKAKAEVESGIWLGQADATSSYRKLSDALRCLLAASIFPQLSIRVARAILEDAFFQLPKSEQIGALQLAASRPTEEAGETFIDRLNKSNLLILEDRRRLLRELVRIQGRWIQAEDLPWIEWQSDKVLLTDGKTNLKRSEIERDEMREAIAEFGSQIRYGWSPKFLVDSLMIHLYPSKNYWENEGQKLFSELGRQDKLWTLRQSLEKAKAQGIDPQTIEKIEAELKSIFVSPNGVSRLDGSSPGVWLASFWSGFKHDPARAIPGVLTGATMTLVFKWSGLKWAFVFIAGDSALRFQTAAVQNPRNLEWYEIDLDRGYSTWVGKTFADMAQNLYQTGSMLWEPKDDFDHLEAWYRTGEMTYDFLAVSVGSAGMSRLLSETSLKMRRLPNKRYRKLEETKSLGRRLTEREGQLREKIRILEAKRNELPDFKDKSSRKIENEIQRLTDELIRINSSSGMKRLSLPSFWARQTGRIFWRAGETLFLARPFPRWQDFRTSNWLRYWQRDFQMTRSQLDDLLSKTDAKWRHSLENPTIQSRLVNREPLSKAENQAIIQNPGENLSAIYQALKVYEDALQKSVAIGKPLQKFIGLLKELLKQEDLALSGVKKLTARPPRTLENWLAGLERFRVGEFRGPKLKLGIQKELRFSGEALEQASTLRLLDASRAFDHLRAIETRLRFRFQTAEFAGSSAQISALKSFGDDLVRVQERLNLELGQRITVITNSISVVKWPDLLTNLKKDRWISPQSTLERSSLKKAVEEAKPAIEVPLTLKSRQGEWKLDSSAKPFEAYFLKTPEGNFEIFIGREVFGEWRVLSRFTLGPL